MTLFSHAARLAMPGSIAVCGSSLTEKYVIAPPLLAGRIVGSTERNIHAP